MVSYKATNNTEEQASRNYEGMRKCLRAGGVNSRLCKPANQTHRIPAHSNAVCNPVLALKPSEIPETTQDFGV